MWVRQGRTDAWIAHKIDVSVDELARFKRDHDLEGGEEGPRGRPADAMSVPAPEPRFDDFDEPEDEEDEDAEEAPAEREPARPRSRNRRRPRRPAADATASAEGDEDEDDEGDGGRRPPRSRAGGRERDGGGRDRQARGREREGGGRDREDGPPEREDGEADGAPRRRRRGRRGGKRHRTPRKAYEATFDHGGEGYGLWLDPSVADNPVYSEHWAGHRAVTVSFDAEAITIRRADTGQPDSDPDGDE
jgi:hypothetical protein